MVIAIDGPAASGKSSVARLLAKTLKFIHLDSGALYRVITLAIMRKFKTEISAKKFIEIMALTKDEDLIKPELLACRLDFIEREQRVYIKQEDVNEAIRGLEISKGVGAIADRQIYRNWINRIMQNLAENNNLVVDGRDIASVVFPDAKYKFFLEAKTEVRALRRWKELDKSSHDISIKKMETEIAKRDNHDINRSSGGLKKIANAIYIDCSLLDVKKTVSIILSHLDRKDIIAVT